MLMVFYAVLHVTACLQAYITYIPFLYNCTEVSLSTFCRQAHIDGKTAT